MIRPEGFVDLRVSPTAPTGANEDSVWPSFTDIMTVVVLIFLIALVVILMRNTELVQQLRETVGEKQQMTAQRGELEMRIAALGDEIVGLQNVLKETEAERAQAQASAQERQQRISALLDDVTALEQIQARLATEKATLLATRETLEGTVAELKQDKSALLATRATLEDEVSALLTIRERLESDKATLLATRETLEGTVAGLEQDKATLLADKASLGEQLATVTGERQQLSADKAALLATRETLEGDIATLLATRETLEGAVAELKQDKSALAADKESLGEQLATTLAQQQQQLLELESVRVGLSDDLNRLQGVLNLEQRASATLAQKVVTLELARHKTVTHLNGLLAQLDSENQGLDASLRQLRNEKYRAEVTLQDRARQIESLSQQVETLLSEKRSQPQPALPAAVTDNPTSPPAAAIATANDPPPQKLSAAAEKTSTNLSTATASSLAAPETGNAVHDVEPRPVAGNPKPVYPPLAIRQQLEGTVVLAIDVLPSGKVANISVEAGSGFTLLDRAAIKAVSQWRFTPAHRAGAPTMVVTQSIQFQLGDGRS